MASHKKVPVSAKAEAGEEDIPSAYLCPITLQIMNDPATDPNNGHTFERATILEWLSRGKAINPLTRKPLRAWELVPNHDLRKEIVQWKKDHGYPESAEQEDNVPWYRRKPTDVDEMTLTTLPPPLTTSIPSGNVFIQRLMEAQRRDAEFRKRINNMAVRYHHFNNSHNHNQNYYNHHQNTSNNGGHSRFR